MQTTFVDLSFARITEQDLNKFEVEMTKWLRKKKHINPNESIQLPEDYRLFLLEINGGIPFLEVFAGAYGKITMSELFYGYYPMRKGDHYGDNLAHQWYGYGEYLDYFDNQIVLPIMQLFHFCQAILVLTGSERGVVYEYDESGYEDGKYVKKIANSFDELFNGADFGIEDEIFYFTRRIKKAILTKNSLELFEYLNHRQFQPDELKDMLNDSISLNYIPAIQKLLEMEAPQDKNTWSFSDASTVELAEFMLKQGFPVNGIDSVGYSPLVWAAQRGNLEVAKYLISQGANTHFLNPKNGNTILMEAEASLQKCKDQYYLNHEKKIKDLNQIIDLLKACN